MSTTVNNNEASSSCTHASNNAESIDLRMKSMEDQINNLSLAFTRFMKEPMFSSNTASRNKPYHDDSDTESEQSDDETSNDVDVPTEYQLSDTLLGQYKHMVNNQGLLVEEECILKKEEISEMNKVFNFPSNFSVNVAPFGTPDGISVSSNVKNNDMDLLILDIIDVLFGNDILKDSIINQKDKLIKLNKSTYKITYQRSDQLECNVKAPRKHIPVSNDHQQSQSNNLLDDDDDIKEQVA
ncbi:hypothetical protein ACTFIZ_012926 [Dictyostelium cf. discoideum]